MKRLFELVVIGCLLGLDASATSPTQSIRVEPGFVYKLRCEGRLLVSSIGDESIVRAEALPKELGCGLVLKPIKAQGLTNLIVETSVGTVIRRVEVMSRTGGQANDEQLEIDLRSEEGGR